MKWAAYLLAFASIGCASAAPIDVTSPSFWLSPNEVANGRALTITGRTGLYFHTDQGCRQIGRYFRISDPKLREKESDLEDLATLVEGSFHATNSKGSLFGILGVILNPERYKPADGRRFLFSGSSWKCMLEHGEKVDQLTRDVAPERVAIYATRSKAMPSLAGTLESQQTVKTYDLSAQGRSYCRVALYLSGSVIEKTRIDVINTKYEIPKFDDYLSMDCITRGLFASIGYVAPMRYGYQEIYDNASLSPAMVANGSYIRPLIDGYLTFIRNN